MVTPKNQSIFKAFSLLKAFKDADEWLSTYELSRRVNMPEASGYRLIKTLEEIGAVVRGPGGRFRLGFLLVTLSQNVTVPLLVQGVGRDIASDTSKRLNATVSVGVLERGMASFLIRAVTPTSYPTQSIEGIQFEAYCSGIGKALLAGLSREQLDIVLDDELVALTPNTITDEAELHRQLDEVRRKGYAIDDCEFSMDLRCIAVPVRDSNGATVAAISASEFADRMTPQRQEELRAGLVQAAGWLSQKICPAGSTTSYGPARSRTQSRAMADVATRC